MSPRTIAACGALLTSLLLPAAAQAVPTLQPLKPCYVTADTANGHQSEGINITGTGFVPNTMVVLAIDGTTVPGGEELQVDELGRVGVRVALPAVPAPFVKSGSKPFTVTLTQVDNPTVVATATAKSTALGVKVKPESARPSQRIRFKGLGFTQDKPIYAHYVHKGKVRKTVRMARKPGECGSFNVRRRQIPVRKPGLGKWIVQFDQSKKFVDPRVQGIVFVRLGIRVRLVPR
jgi:hypothetical protein